MAVIKLPIIDSVSFIKPELCLFFEYSMSCLSPSVMHIEEEGGELINLPKPHSHRSLVDFQKIVFQSKLGKWWRLFQIGFQVFLHGQMQSIIQCRPM